MTNQETVKMLEYIRQTGNGESAYKHYAQSVALDMAIKALSVDYEGMIEEIEEKKSNVNGTYETWQKDKALYTGYEVALSIIRKYVGGREYGD